MLRRLGCLLFLGIAAIAIVVVVRTAMFRPRQLETAPAPRRAIDEPAVAAKLAAAIRVPTVSTGPGAPPSAETLAELRQRLAAAFPRVWATLGREEIGNGGLLLRWAGSESRLPPLLLLAHQDVVPVDAESRTKWTRDPFGGEIVDGFVWGRGAIDDKGSLVATLEAVEELLAEGFQPKRTLLLAFGQDEEIGGSAGAVEIARKLAAENVRPVLVLDEGGVLTDGVVPSMKRRVALVNLAEKGSLTVELSVAIEGGHSSMPKHATAIGVLARAVARLEAHPMPARLVEPALSGFETMAAEEGWMARALMSNLWLFRPLALRALAGTPSTDAMIRTTTAPTIIAGGVKENVLPEKARATVNFRLLPGDTAAAVLAHVREAVDDPRVEIRTAGALSAEASKVSTPAGFGYEQLTRTIREVFPDAAVANGLLVGATDSRSYAALSDAIYRFAPYRIAASDLARFHGIDERIAVADLAEMVRFYARLIQNAAG